MLSPMKRTIILSGLLSGAFAIPNIPRATSSSENEWSSQGWTPKPTEKPRIELNKRDLFPRSLTSGQLFGYTAQDNTCGYVNGVLGESIRDCEPSLSTSSLSAPLQVQSGPVMQPSNVLPSLAFPPARLDVVIHRFQGPVTGLEHVMDPQISIRRRNATTPVNKQRTSYYGGSSSFSHFKSEARIDQTSVRRAHCHTAMVM
jgi:hypothetical protein